MFDFDAGLPAEIVPLSWLLGVWEGTGILSYRMGDEVREAEFGHRVAFTHDGTPRVQYAGSSWLTDESGDNTPLYSEIGYWRLSRALGDGDQGPGMLPPVGEAVFTTAEAVETLRNERGAFDIEVSILQPGGVAEIYLGEV
ncbi:MAG: heme-binding beta-barrel domain-containing protein, partial [Rhodoglobus sp.]